MSENRLSGNRLSGNRLSGNRLSGNRLSGNSIAADPVVLGDLADTEDGREYLTYLVKCALPEGLDLVVLDSDGVTERYRFAGLIGLTPEWETRPLTVSEQRWLSACLLAHVNAFGVSVPISLRGNHPALATVQPEQKDYPVKEAAFYGNLFQDIDDDGEADQLMYACHGVSKPKLANSSYLQLRICGAEDPSADGVTYCDFVAVSDCGADSGAAERACESPGGAKDGYAGCHSQARTPSNTWPVTAERYDEVITVFLAE